MLTFGPQHGEIEAISDEIALVETQSERSDTAKHHRTVPLVRVKDSEAWTTHMEVSPERISIHSEELPAGVRTALQRARQTTITKCIRQYPKAVAWSLCLFLTVVMEAYDKSLISGFMAFPAFQRRYGTPLHSPTEPLGEQRYEISPPWQMALQNAALACEIIGLLAHGYITYSIGYRKMLILCLLWLALAIIPSVFAPNIGVLVAGQALSGLPWGVIQTLAATYAAEVVPSTLRACVLSNVNMCWLVGQFVGMGVLRLLIHDDSMWSYRIPLATQWAFILPLLVGVYFCPDSPWWLIRHERQSDARRALQRLVNQDQLDIDDTIMVMEHTNMIEKRYNYGGAQYRDCFKGANARRTEIACVVWACQSFCGSTLIAYAPYFLLQAGFNPARSFDFSTGMYGMGIIGGFISWGLLSFIGRRKLYLLGLSFALMFLTTGGLLSVVLPSNKVMNWILGGLIIAMAFTYNTTIGPVCYVLVAEMPSTRLRVKTVALARVAYNLCTMINNILAPQMLNPTAWNLKGKACFVYVGSTLLCLIWCFLRLPESKSLSYLELDILFEKRAPTAKFRELQDRLQGTGYMSASRMDRSRNSWHGWMAYS